MNQLTMDQLRRIFSGECANWSEMGGPNSPITVTARAVPQTGAGVEFQKTVLKGGPYATGHLVMALYRDTVTVCSKGMAIGYLPTTSHFFKYLQRQGVKPIAVSLDANSPAIVPSSGLVTHTDYPINIPVYLYINSAGGKECVSEFPDFCLRAVAGLKRAHQ